MEKVSAWIWRVVGGERYMGAGEIAVLGAVAGGTIFIGLPVGRLERTPAGMRAFLNATATGILLFLLWDVLSHAVEPVEGALTAATDGDGSWLRFAGLCAVFAAGLAVGLLSLVGYERVAAARARRPVPQPEGPGAMTAAGAGTRRGLRDVSTPASRLALMIAVGIGMHNLSEGLAIGQSAA